MKLQGKPGRRPRSRTAALCTAGVTAVALVIAGCSSSSSSGSSPGSGGSSQPITVGISVSLSGDFSGDGLATKQGYETWAAYQNAHGGILGRQIKLSFLSDGSSPTQVITNYQKLITVNHVNFVMGPYSTLLTKPASAIANRYGYVMIEGIGGKLESLYFAFGDIDLYAVVDLPDSASAAAMSLAVNQGGAATAKIVVLITPEEMDKAGKVSVKYKPPGH